MAEGAREARERERQLERNGRTVREREAEPQVGV
jgi:hypothetical protein